MENTVAGNLVIPQKKPTTAAIITARKIPPLTFRPVKTAIKITPKIATKLDGDCKSPMLISVAGLLTTRPALLKPIRAINRPMPAVTASLMVCGIALNKYSFSGVTAMSKNTNPLQAAPSKQKQNYAPFELRWCTQRMH